MTSEDGVRWMPSFFASILIFKIRHYSHEFPNTIEEKRRNGHMIDIVTDKGRYLKNLRQIGTPEESDCVYIEDEVYRVLHDRRSEEKALFVLMGHNECEKGSYTTFVEGYIQVKDTTFEGNSPIWTNSTWSKVFHEIKDTYAEQIIVGWAIRNMTSPVRITPKLEELHREHFGGAREFLILMNPLMEEENVYFYRDTGLTPKAGFFIYYDPSVRRLPKIAIEQVQPETEPVTTSESLMENASPSERPMGQYRELLRMQSNPPSGKGWSVALVCILCVMILLMGISIFRDKDKLMKLEDSIDAWTTGDSKNTLIIESGTDTEVGGDLIPVTEAPKE